MEYALLGVTFRLIVLRIISRLYIDYILYVIDTIMLFNCIVISTWRKMYLEIGTG